MMQKLLNLKGVVYDRVFYFKYKWLALQNIARK